MSEIQVGQINSTDGSTAITTGADGYVSFAKTQIGGRRNLIINGGFNVWQRGTSFSAIGNNVFAPDRWYATKVATGCTISRDTGTYSKYAMLITGDASNTAQSMSQRIESSLSFNMSLNDHTFSAKVYTSVDRTVAVQMRSATAEDDFSGNTLQQNTSVNLVTGWNTINVLVPAASAYNLGVQATLAFGAVGAGETVKVEQVQLEVGTVATPFEHRSYGEELALCQRYYQRVGSTSGDSMTPIYATRNTTNQALLGYSAVQCLRATPTVAMSGSFTLYGDGSGESLGAFGTVTANQIENRQVTWTQTASGIGTGAGKVCYGSSAYFEFDAEL